MENRQKLVDLCLEALELTRNGMRLSKNARVGLKLTIVQCMDMPEALVNQGIEAIEDFNKRLRKR